MTTPLEPSTAPPIPWQGLLEALRGYSGRGQLYNAIASVAGDDIWSARDVRLRAHRVLLEQCAPLLARLPSSTTAWLDALPAQSHQRREDASAPIGRVDWPRTRLGGWPPQKFAVTKRSRQADEVLVTTLAWAANTLHDVRQDSLMVAPESDMNVRLQLSALEALLHLPPVNQAVRARPGRPELAAARWSGRPWAALADVAQSLLGAERDVEQTARMLLYPDDDLRWRLFHLGCLGNVLATVRRIGCQVIGLRPLGIGSGPAYRVVDLEGREWDLWFEAGGMWRHYGVDSPYVQATRGLPGAGQPLGADLALVLPGESALLVECKYSKNPSYIGRQGYEQAMTYLAEARSGLVSRATAAVVGPEGVVTSGSSVSTFVGPVIVIPPSGLEHLVNSVLANRWSHPHVRWGYVESNDGS